MSESPIRLRPELIFSPTRSPDSVSYVVEDRVQQKFWKIGALEYEVCAAIDGKRTAMESLGILLQNNPRAMAAGPEKVQKILMWLMHSGLVESCIPLPTPDEIGKTPPPASKPPKLFDPSFFRIPLLSADVIEKYAHSLSWLISIPCLIAAMIAWCVAVSMAYQNNQDLMGLGSKLFVPGSQWWWLLAWFVLKAVHESGHAIACTRVGARTNGAGIGFMFFAPSPYVDVTNLWSNNHKWSRILVSASGMLFELTLAAIAVIGACWFENPSIRYLCFTIATLGTFTTIAFNGNPLMRYDGYYILIDLIGRPNLWQDATQSMKSFFATRIYKNRNSHCLSIPLLVYGIASWISRMLLLATMGWGMWKTWDGIGLLVVAFFTCLWFIIPPVMKLLKGPTPATPWSWKSSFAHICPGKFAQAFGLVALLAVCGLLPSPMQIYWPAIVDYVDPSDVRTTAPGFVEEVFVHDGQGVRAGEEILRLRNPALELEYQTALSAQKASEEKCNALRAQKKHSELQAEEAVYESLVVKANSLKTKVDSLRLKSPRDGVLISRMTQNLTGSYIPEGQSMGIVADPSQIEVVASVPQDAWDIISKSQSAPVSIYLANGERWVGKVSKTLPRTSDTLDAPSLGGLYGGPIPVEMGKSPSGEERLTTSSPRLQTRVELERAYSSHSITPPPGVHCAVHLTNEREAIWQTACRWVQAAAHSRFQDTTH